MGSYFQTVYTNDSMIWKILLLQRNTTYQGRNWIRGRASKSDSLRCSRRECYQAVLVLITQTTQLSPSQSLDAPPKGLCESYQGKKRAKLPLSLFSCQRTRFCVCVWLSSYVYVYHIYMHLDFGGLSFSFVVRYFPQRVNVRLRLWVWGASSRFLTITNVM